MFPSQRLNLFLKMFKAVVHQLLPIWLRHSAMSLFGLQGYCTGLFCACSLGRGCSAPEVITISYKCTTRWACYVYYYYGVVWVSAAKQAEPEVLFCWNDLMVALDPAAQARWVCPVVLQQMLQVLVRRNSWNAEQQPQGSAEKHHPIVLEVFSRTTGSVVRNEEIIRGSFRCREFLLVK